jgi:hypothetical protein
MPGGKVPPAEGNGAPDGGSEQTSSVPRNFAFEGAVVLLRKTVWAPTFRERGGRDEHQAQASVWKRIGGRG